MTRIRRNWSSSRATQGVDVDPQPSFASVAINDSYVPDTKGKPQAPIVFQPDDDYAINMLAAVTLKYLEQESSIRNLKRENVYSQVMAAMKAKSLHREPDLKNVQHERDSAEVWEHSDIQSRLVSKSSRKSDKSYDRKQSALRNSDHGPGASPNKVEMVDSYLTAPVEGAKTSQVRPERIQGVIPGRCVEREPSIEDTPRGFRFELDFGHSSGIKRRHKPWESDLEHAPSTADCKTHQRSLTSEVHGASPERNKLRRLRIVRTPPDEAACFRFTIRAGPADAVADNGNVNEPGLKQTNVSTNDSVGMNQPIAKSEQVRKDADDRNELKEKAEKGMNARDDQNKKTARTDHLDETTTVSGTQQRSIGEETFPTGWKYKGLAEIAEKDEATNGQVKKQCGRTDGQNWRCPLRTVEGLTLCQHHLNKARAKTLGNSNKPQAKTFGSGNQPRRDQRRRRSQSKSFAPSL